MDRDALVYHRGVCVLCCLELGCKNFKVPRENAEMVAGCRFLRHGERGVWSMHFVGMLAFHVNVPVNYDIPIRLLCYAVLWRLSSLFRCCCLKA